MSWRLSALMLAFSASAVMALELTDGWIPLPPPGASVAAGYLTLRNPTSGSVKVVGAESAAFGSVKLHRTVIENGIAHMEPVPVVKVPAYGEVRLTPGGMHLMLMKPVQALHVGERIPLYLILDSGARLAVQLRVVAPGSTGDERVHKHE